MPRIGYQNGISAAIVRMRKLDPTGFNDTGSGAWDKFFRTIATLAQDHDAAIAAPAPQPTPTPAPTPAPAKRPFPQTYNRGGSGQDARYCTGGRDVDDMGYRYDGQGLSLGGRSGNPIAGLKPSDQMDGADPCTGYDGMPPWPPGSYNV